MDESLKGREIKKNGLLPISGSLSQQRILRCDREFWFSIATESPSCDRALLALCHDRA